MKQGDVTVSKLIIIAQKQRSETHGAILGTALDSTGARQQKGTKDIWKSRVVKVAKSFCSHSALSEGMLWNGLDQSREKQMYF